jgi:hypothetical protein
VLPRTCNKSVFPSFGRFLLVGSRGGRGPALPRRRCLGAVSAAPAHVGVVGWCACKRSHRCLGKGPRTFVAGVGGQLSQPSDVGRLERRKARRGGGLLAWSMKRSKPARGVQMSRSLAGVWPSTRKP